MHGWCCPAGTGKKERRRQGEERRGRRQSEEDRVKNSTDCVSTTYVGLLGLERRKEKDREKKEEEEDRVKRQSEEDH